VYKLRGEYDGQDMNILKDTCFAYMSPSLNGFKPVHMYRIHVSSMFMRAYRYFVHVRDAGTHL